MYLDRLHHYKQAISEFISLVFSRDPYNLIFHFSFSTFDFYIYSSAQISERSVSFLGQNDLPHVREYIVHAGSCCDHADLS